MGNLQCFIFFTINIKCRDSCIITSLSFFHVLFIICFTGYDSGNSFLDMFRVYDDDARDVIRLLRINNMPCFYMFSQCSVGKS